MSVHVEPESVFTLGRNRCSRSPEYANAGLNENIIAEEVEIAKDYLATHLSRVKNYIGKSDSQYIKEFVNYYDGSPYLRGIFQAAYNNLPLAANRGTLYAMIQAEKEKFPPLSRFIEIYKIQLQQGYDSLGDPQGATRLIKVTKHGANF